MTEIVSMSTVNGIHNIESKNKISTNGNISGGFFYKVKNGSSFIMTKSLSKNLSVENKYSMFPENWHFNSCFVLKTTKTPFSLLRVFGKLFYVINDDLFLKL